MLLIAAISMFIFGYTAGGDHAKSVLAASDSAACPVQADPCVNFAPAPSPTDWTKLGAIISPDQEWEDGGVWEPNVVYHGGKYRMWYTGGWTPSAIGYAESRDGITWEKYADNPIVGGGAGDFALRASQPTIVRHSGTYYLYFAGGSAGALTRSQLYLATSTDGIHFETHPEPVLLRDTTSWDRSIANTAIWIEGNTWHMVYEALRPSGGSWHMGYATSPDGSVWTKVNGPWCPGNLGTCGGPMVTRQGGGYSMLLHGLEGDFLPTDIYMTRSADPAHWDGAVELVMTRTLDFEYDQVADPFLLEQGNKSLLYYAGCDNRDWLNVVCKIGLAVRDRAVGRGVD